MIKFALKLGIAGTAIYYINEEGIWKGSNTSVQTLEKYRENMKPYIQEAKAQIPIEFPNLPATNNLSSLMKESWNRGVLVSFQFLSNLPATVSEWTSKGLDKAKENPELKNFIGSFSGKTDVEKN